MVKIDIAKIGVRVEPNLVIKLDTADADLPKLGDTELKTKLLAGKIITMGKTNMEIEGVVFKIPDEFDIGNLDVSPMQVKMTPARKVLALEVKNKEAEAVMDVDAEITKVEQIDTVGVTQKTAETSIAKTAKTVGKSEFDTNVEIAAVTAKIHTYPKLQKIIDAFNSKVGIAGMGILAILIYSWTKGQTINETINDMITDAAGVLATGIKALGEAGGIVAGSVFGTDSSDKPGLFGGIRGFFGKVGTTVKRVFYIIIGLLLVGLFYKLYTMFRS